VTAELIKDIFASTTASPKNSIITYFPIIYVLEINSLPYELYRTSQKLSRTSSEIVEVPEGSIFWNHEHPPKIYPIFR
jgi:hypothetical protein